LVFQKKITLAAGEKPPPSLILTIKEIMQSQVFIKVVREYIYLTPMKAT
jgi:hypothetical protein